MSVTGAADVGSDGSDRTDPVGELFEEVDEDGSGELDIDEVRKLCKRLGQKLDNAGVSRAFREMDADASGGVDLQVRLSFTCVGARSCGVALSRCDVTNSGRLHSGAMLNLSTCAGISVVVGEQCHQPRWFVPPIHGAHGARQVGQGGYGGAARR
jgi:hypothetical protein